MSASCGAPPITGRASQRRAMRVRDVKGAEENGPNGFRSRDVVTITGALLLSVAIDRSPLIRRPLVPAKFTLIKDKAGFRFELLAANGAVVATSAMYATKA